MLRAMCHHPEQGWTEISDPAAISDELARQGNVLWAFADVSEITRKDIDLIAQEFNLDPLAVEDALNLRQRPKLEGYKAHLFAIAHQLDEEEGQLEAHQIACFIGRNFVLTVHDRSSRTIDDAFARVQRAERAEGQGPSFVMHALLDAVVDDYQGIADDLEHRIEAIEDIALKDPHVRLQRDLYGLRQQLSRLRRYIVPGERVLGTMLEPARGIVNEQTATKFRDVHDHTRRIIEQIGNVQALVDAVTELQRSEQAMSLSEVTKRLTGWAAIIAVPTLIASFYGMNFRLFPRDQTAFGFWFATGMMVVSGVILYVYFRRKDWI